MIIEPESNPVSPVATTADHHHHHGGFTPSPQASQCRSLGHNSRFAFAGGEDIDAGLVKVAKEKNDFKQTAFGQ